MIDDVGGGTAGAWDKGTWDNVNPLGPLDGGTVGGRVADVGLGATEKIDLIRRQHIRMRALEAVANAARAVRLRPSSNVCWDKLADALDALDGKIGG